MTIFLILKNLLVIVLLSITISGLSQSFTLPNEEVIYSFNTENGKKVTFNKDKQNNYIVYRFGSKDKIKFEFPDKIKSSFKQFTFSSYLRGGGTQNAGMDLNYVYFINNGFEYVIYDTYFAEGNEQNIGVKIINLQTKKTTNIKGNTKTRKGTLIDFRDNHLLKMGDELFD